MDPRLSQGIIQAVDTRFNQLRRAEPYTVYGVVATVDAVNRKVSVFLSGDADASAGFAYPPRMAPEVGEMVRVVVDPRGDRYVDEVFSAISLGTWVTPTLTNGWVQLSPATSYPVGFTRLASGLVVFRGLVASGTVGYSNSTVFILPVGYRPAYHHYFLTRTISDGVGTVQVFPTGEVQIQSGSNGWQSLDMIRYVYNG